MNIYDIFGSGRKPAVTESKIEVVHEYVNEDFSGLMFGANNEDIAGPGGSDNNDSTSPIHGFGEDYDNIPDLENIGEQVVSIMDAERRLAQGDRIFAFHEMDEEPSEIHDVGQLAGYDAEQLLAVPQGVAEGSLEEYGDTAKGQKMLGKVHNRAADQVTSKKADKDPAYARKAQQTQDRAWDRLAVKEQGVAEEVNPEVTSDDYTEPSQNVRMGDFVFNARTFTGALGSPNAKGLQIRAYDPKNLKSSIGSADFIVRKDKKGNQWLESDDTEVNDEYRGKGVATLMYAFAKSLGNDIKDSPYKSKAGSDMWTKWGSDAKHLVGEQGVAEGLPQTLRKVVPGYAKREIDRKMDAGKFGKTDADKDANFQRYKKIQDKLKKQGVAEAFDNPYKTKTEKSDYGDVDMLAKLPDGTNLSIMFNNQGDDEWQVEFYRNNSQEVTGEGDAQRVFATVLASMQKFIKKYKPWRLTFSATKLLDPSTYYEPDQPVPNPESRAKLYNRLVQRYATAWGYEEYAEDHGDQITYELTRLKQGVAEAPHDDEVDYDDKYQAMVKRVGQKAREQQRHEPVDLVKLAQRLRQADKTTDTTDEDVMESRLSAMKRAGYDIL